jgi:hypothetical protein
MLLLVTVNVSWVLVTEVMPIEVPLLTPLILLAEPPFPLIRVIRTVGAVPPVSKTKPFGIFRIIVPVPTVPPTLSL